MHFCEIPYLILKMHLLLGAGLPGERHISIHSNMIWEKVKSLYYNFKQKKGERLKTGEFDDSKGWFHNFRKRFGLKSVKITGEAASDD